MIQIEYVWDKNIALKSAQEIYEYELKNSNKKFIGWLFIGLAQFGVVGALKHNAYGFLVIATVALTYWYALRWPLRKYFINKTFDKSPLADKNIKLEIQKDGLYSNDQIQISYDNIKRFVKLDNAIVIYHNMGTIYLPDNGFQSNNDKNQFIKILEKSNK
jgi:hypothetical protein